MTDNSALRPDALTPKEITEKVLGLGVTKSSMDLRTQLPLTVLAGFYIGLGGLFCTLFMSDSTLPFAVQKFMAVPSSRSASTSCSSQVPSSTRAIPCSRVRPSTAASAGARRS